MNTPLTASFALLTFALVGCGEVVPQNQVGIAPSPAPVVDAGAEDAGPAPLRTVETRNPFGNLTPTNLVLDGDFEFTGRQGQMPWLNFSSSQQTLDFETGGLCASGVRCAKVTRGSALFGWIVSPQSPSRIDVSIKARMLTGDPKREATEGTCAEPKINVYVIDVENTNIAEPLRFERNTPAVNGFCTYQAIVNAVPFASPGIYVEPDELGARDVVLIDAAVATAVSTASTRAFVPHEPTKAASAATKARVVKLVDWIRRNRKLVAPRLPTSND